MKIVIQLKPYQACYYEQQKYIEAGMKAIEGALGALMRDKIEQSKNYDEAGITRCLLLRSKLMLEAKETLNLDIFKNGSKSEKK